VGGEDMYFATAIEGPLAMMLRMAGDMDGMPQFEKIDAFGLGVSMSSKSVSVKGQAKFKRERDARRLKEDIDSGIEDFEELIEDAPDSERAAMEAAIDLVKAARVKQRNDTTYISGKWKVSDIQDVIDSM
jgi:hypothetical protein